MQLPPLAETGATPTAETIAAFRERIQQCNRELETRFTSDCLQQERPCDIDRLLHSRSRFIDQILLETWPVFMGARSRDHALIAVGGYGRQELNLHSDIDLLVLLDGHCDASSEMLGRFFCFLWDIGLKPGHSVRTLPECTEAAHSDQTVITNLIEGRLLTGSTSLWEALTEAIHSQHMWASADFFQAKLQEQRCRYDKYDHTACNLEPNVKEGPGGLRDIQLIAWIMRRHYGSHQLEDLVSKGWLTQDEYLELTDGRQFLQRVRFALHHVTGRAEDRLLFEYQREIAELFGFSTQNRDQQHPNAVVEAFMQRYFRMVTGLERLNDLLLQLFHDAVLASDPAPLPEQLNAHFQTINGYIEVTQEHVFLERPVALLEIFLLLQQHPELKGIRASTIRLIRQHIYLIDENYRQDPAACRVFMEILRQSSGVTHQFFLMNRYGILGAWLPEFERVSGRMQYDLFHVYTVDEHTLFVIRNLRRFSIPEFREETPHCHTVFANIDRPEMLYIAGLMHDIGKGSGHDHSEAGTVIAAAFCQRHAIGQRDSLRIQWLVRHHLLMSLTAQRKDISDPEVIHEFASIVGDHDTLNHLYLLTIADIRATNPNIWNSWKNALLQQLYTSASRALRRGLHHPPDQSSIISTIKDESRTLLQRLGMATEACTSLWDRFGEDYFLRFLPEEIAWHTLAIALTPGSDMPLVLLRPVSLRGCAEIFIYHEDEDGLFAHCTAILDQLGLSIMDARIITDRSGSALLSFNVLEENGAPLRDPLRQVQICRRLKQDLLYDGPRGDTSPPRVHRRENRGARHFAIPTQVSFHEDPQQRHTILELIATDRPGLLSKVGQALTEEGIRLKNAKVSTLGSQAEDIFFITDANDCPLQDPQRQARLAAAIIEHVGNQ